jgi:hypothetical protein
MSILVAAAVMVGAPATLHLTPVNVAVPLPVEAACFKSNIKDLPAVAVGIVKVVAIDAGKVAVRTVPLDKDSVAEPTPPPVLMVTALTVST